MADAEKPMSKLIKNIVVMKKIVLIILFSTYCLNAYFQKKTNSPKMKGVTTYEYYDRAKTKLEHVMTEYPDGTKYVKYYYESGKLYEEGLITDWSILKLKRYDKFGNLLLMYNYDNDKNLDGECAIYEYVPDYSKTYLSEYALCKKGILILAKQFHKNGKIALLYQNNAFITYNDNGREQVNFKIQNLPNDIIQIIANRKIEDDGILEKYFIKTQTGEIIDFKGEVFDNNGTLNYKSYLEKDSISGTYILSSFEKEKCIYKRKVKYPNFIDKLKKNNFSVENVENSNNGGHRIVFPKFYGILDQNNYDDVLGEILSTTYMIEEIK
ncbi:MAG: hypothetical protein ACOYMA_18885 [Bacteroidia bacterium]